MTRKKVRIIVLVTMLLIAMCTVYYMFFFNTAQVYNGTLV